jgi:hypothetical protein
MSEKSYTIRHVKNAKPLNYKNGGWFSCKAKSVKEAIEKFKDDATILNSIGDRILWIREAFKTRYFTTKNGRLFRIVNPHVPACVHLFD